MNEKNNAVAQTGATRRMGRQWFEKGATGEVLRGIADEAVGQVTVTQQGSFANIRDEKRIFINLTLRGSSKCRRKQARTLARWFQLRGAQ